MQTVSGTLNPRGGRDLEMRPSRSGSRPGSGAGKPGPPSLGFASEVGDGGGMTQTATREVGVTELVLRDAHQSLMATRMALEDMVDACADIDAAGYWSVECWGGATYDACI